MNKTCVVAVPIYKKTFSHDEEMCVRKYASVFSEEKLIFICPDSLDRSYYLDRFPAFEYEPFQDRFFKGIKGYNRLMLSESFYERFDKFDYILIAQPDAVIWRDENMLSHFMDKGFDYYGAPWIPERRIWEWTWVRDTDGKHGVIECAKKKDHGIVMGNGGFSLRKIKPCIKLIHEHRWRKIYWFIKRNEDIFFGLLGRRGNNRCDFKLADIETGKAFALEYDLKDYVEKGEVPFGVHGWNKYFDSFEEMEKYLKEKGVWH